MVPVKAVCIWRMSYLMKSVTLPFPCSDFSLRSFRKGATCSHIGSRMEICILVSTNYYHAIAKQRKAAPV